MRFIRILPAILLFSCVTEAHALDARKADEILAFAKKLIAIPSQNGADSEAAMAKAVFDKLKEFGFNPKIVGAEEHPSVVCLLKKGKGKTIWLESMLDTVPAGDAGKWHFPPFSATLKGSKLYGRGSADSKTAIALFIYLAKDLYEDPAFAGSIFLGFDADEQSGDFTGIREVLKFAPKADVCILGYQSDKSIGIGARGWLRLKLSVFGRGAHTGSVSNKGVNAVHYMAKAVTALDALKLGGARDAFFEFGPSLNVSVIRGGEAVNMVPDSAEALIDIRLLPSQTRESILGQLRSELDLLAKNDPLFKYAIEVLQYEPAYLASPERHPFANILSARASKAFGRKVPLVANGQGSVGNVISRLEVPIVNSFGCSTGNGHAPDEWIDSGMLPAVYDVYKESILEFSGGEAP